MFPSGFREGFRANFVSAAVQGGEAPTIIPDGLAPPPAGNFGSTTAQLTELSLTPGQYVLVQAAQGAGGTTPLPALFITDPNPIAMSVTAGKVALVNTTAPLNCGAAAMACSPASLAQIVDLAATTRRQISRRDSRDIPAPGPSIAG